MPVKRKGFRFTRSEDDYGLYKFMYYGYSNKITINLHLQDKKKLIKKNQLIAVIVNEDNQEEKIESPYSG